MNNQIEIQKLFEKIKSLSKSVKFTEVTEIIDQVVAKDPQSAAEAYYICGSNFYVPIGGNSHSISESCFMRAIEIEPSHVKARMALAQLYFSTPVSIMIKYGRGSKIDIEEKRRNAITEYTRVIEIDPDYSEAYEHLAYIYEYSGAHELAIKYFSDAVNLSPDNIRLRLARGNLYLKNEKYVAALRDILKILSLDPANPDAVTLLEPTLNKKNDLLDENSIEKIIKEYEENIDVNDTDPVVTHKILPPLSNLYKMFGLILVKNENYKQAISKYKKSIEYLYKTPSPQDSDTYYLLGNAYSALGQYKEAIVEYDRAVRIKHDHSDASEGRSSALLKLIEKQESDFQERIEGFLSGPNSIFGLQDRFLEREKEYSNRYYDINLLIGFSFFLIVMAIILGIAVLGWWINRSTGFSFIERNAFSLLPYIAVLLLFTAIPVWWTRILLKSRDRWQILREDCFRKAAIMQYLQATGSDKEFRNHIILETIQHMANRSGADLLVALHSDDPGMPYSATDIMEKIIKKRPANG